MKALKRLGAVIMKALVFSNTQEASNFTKANINKGFVLVLDI